MQTKLDGQTTHRFGTSTPVATTASTGYIDDNFLMHLAPVSLGVFFFGAFHPNPEDKLQAHRALYKTSFLYRHFLQPGGLRVVVDEGTLTLTGKTSSSAVSLMAQALGEKIMGKIKVVDQTTRADEMGQTARPDGRADAELRARLQLILATDNLLSSEELEVHVSNLQAKVTGKVATAEHKAWAETLLHGVVPPVKLAIQVSPRPKSEEPRKSTAFIDEDSLQALAVTRVKMIPSVGSLDVRINAQHQTLSVTCFGASPAEKSLIESVVKHTYGIREFRVSK